MKIACLTVFYNGMETFIDEYIECINNQTYKDFTLFIINDGFKGELNEIEKKLTTKVIIRNASFEPYLNRIFGLEQCKNHGFELVICSDSDETMYPDRIEQNVKYFGRNPNALIVYNNSVYDNGVEYFDLFYKKVICLNDIIDFNVLGYGALNIKVDLVPFVQSLRNTNVLVFDWWLGLRYLLENDHVEVLDNARNNYRLHSDNIIGPTIKINKKSIYFSIDVKTSIYNEMLAYCRSNNLHKKVNLFKKKLNEIEQVIRFIKKNSMSKYIQLVNTYFEREKKIFWFQNVISLNKLGVKLNEEY